MLKGGLNEQLYGVSMEQFVLLQSGWKQGKNDGLMHTKEKTIIEKKKTV